MENWKTHFLSFIVIWAFLIVALASEDDKLLVSSNTPCTDEATLNSEPLPADNGHPITYEVKVIDRETNQPLPEMTVKVDAISYNCLTIEACPDKCYMKSTFQADGQFIGLTNANGTITVTIPNWKANDTKDRMKLIVKIKDENLYEYAYRRKDIIVGQSETSVSITMALLKDLQ